MVDGAALATLGAALTIGAVVLDGAARGKLGAVVLDGAALPPVSTLGAALGSSARRARRGAALATLGAAILPILRSAVIHVDYLHALPHD
ncbi:hypothetical protein [Polyangium spumosum]|uniref:Uncharacterized protein n=1 Tax=Polyangium spumosum TaxID=889282 RepID=A0A6N7Q5I7_9BACT|nr:hypothetical protein [Polyangium spumosum]MRG98140.1 hypothetical protein [Polyangium spumosum]